MNRISFAPYSRQQLQTILTQRLQQVGFRFAASNASASSSSSSSSSSASSYASSSALRGSGGGGDEDADEEEELVGTLFHPDAIELCARKVSLLSLSRRQNTCKYC
jgi:Cdc6-like AAA superfamily ATPase